MYNLLISLGVGLAITLAVKLAGFPLWAGIVPGLLAFVGTYIVLARRVANRLQLLMADVQKDLQGQPTNQKEALQRLERATRKLESGLVYDKWQFLVGPELHAQMAMLKYAGRDFPGAQVHFARANPRNAMSRAYEGAMRFQLKEYGPMQAAFEDAVKHGRKEPILWAVYAWCLVETKERDKALQVLARGVEANPSDEPLKTNLTALQNGKRLKMKAFGPLWWQFGLETPPPQTVMGGRRVQFLHRR